ncbi:MAG: MATE family efflux transporter [Pseudooceanicola sp.]|nr:MATE family efflux transporter [Pseudooceanicola sp.]
MSHPLLAAPIGPTILRMAAPNVIAMLATLATSVAEVWYVGHLGIPALAGLALAFPMFMLNLMISAGSMGGAVSGAIAQRLGAGDRDGAEALAFHAVVLAVVLSLVSAAVFLTLGPRIYAALGGSGEVLARALAYSNMLFLGCTALWLANTLSGIVRATGHMGVSARGLMAGSAVQIVVGGALVFGVGPLPQLGIAGAAAGAIVGFTVSTLILGFFLLYRCRELTLQLAGIPLRLAVFADLLRVGALASVSPFTSIGTVLAITGLVARLGPDALAGYGIGSRLEFLMIPLVFGFGAATITMVGVHFGARAYARGHRIAWTAATYSALMTGIIGALMAAFPGLWADLFTDSEAVRETCRLYLRIVGPFYALFGFGQCLYFASQGARRMLWPVIGSLLRFLTVLVGGMVLVASGPVAAPTIFTLIVASLVVYAAVTAIAIWRGAWMRGIVAVPA